MLNTQSRRMGTGDRLLDILCKVCGDRSSGKHYGVFTCDGCSGFFKRSVHEHRVYDCKKKGKDRGSCPINKSLRNQCRACRYAKCLQVNMNKDAVQHERGPRKPKVHPNLRKEQLPQQPPIVTQLSPYCRTSLHSDRLRPAHRLSRDHRFNPYPRPVPVSQKPPEDDSSPIPLTLPQSPTTTTLRQPSLLEILIVVETCPELAWREDLQPENETSTEQGEGDTVHSPPRPLQPCDPTWEETTAYLLFKSVKWVGRLPYFQTLSEHDRMLLLTRSWPQLFLLHLAQWSISWDITGWLTSEQVRERSPKDDKQELNIIQHIMCRFRQLAPDPGECGSMKTVALFMPETEGLDDVQAVENLQNYVQQMLAVYTPSRYPNELGRVGSLMHLVGLLRAVNEKTVVVLFFPQTIGEASTSDVLVTIYKKYANENIAPSRSFLQNISLPAFRNSAESFCRTAPENEKSFQSVPPKTGNFMCYEHEHEGILPLRDACL